MRKLGSMENEIWKKFQELKKELYKKRKLSLWDVSWRYGISYASIERLAEKDEEVKVTTEPTLTGRGFRKVLVLT